MGAMESSQSEASNSSAVDRMFCCPVCYEKFTSRIFQCKSGHAVCSDCKGKLDRCPHCCGAYQGARNFVLEEIIFELDRLNFSPEQAVKAVRDAAHADFCRNMTNMIDQLRQQTEAFASAASTSAASLGASQSLAPASPANTENTVCRMQYCRQTMKLKDLERHLIDKHSTNVRRLVATNYLSKSHYTFTLLCTNNRFALLTEFGIFFLIIRVTPSRIILGRLTVTAWIQGACTSVEASLFYSFLQIEVKHTKATYHDIVHHSRSTVAQIEDADECLMFSVNAEDYDNLNIRGYVCLNRCKEDRPRRSLATVIERLRDYDDYSSD